MENRSIATGQAVRFMECPQLWVAELMAARANESFAEHGRAYVSYVIQLY